MIMPRMPSSRHSTVRKNICRLLPAFAGTGFGAVAKLRQQLPVVFEIDAQHDWNAEDELSMGDGIEDVLLGIRYFLLNQTRHKRGDTKCPLARQ
jgi:hypothetical protein